MNDNINNESKEISYQLGAINATLSGIHRDISQLRGEISELEEANKNTIISATTALHSRLDKQSKRIADLEKKQWVITGAVSLAIFLVGILPKLLEFLK